MAAMPAMPAIRPTTARREADPVCIFVVSLSLSLGTVAASGSPGPRSAGPLRSRRRAWTGCQTFVQPAIDVYNIASLDGLFLRLQRNPPDLSALMYTSPPDAVTLPAIYGEVGRASGRERVWP